MYSGQGLPPPSPPTRLTQRMTAVDALRQSKILLWLAIQVLEVAIDVRRAGLRFLRNRNADVEQRRVARIGTRVVGVGRRRRSWAVCGRGIVHHQDATMGIQFVSYQITDHSICVIFHVHLTLVGNQIRESVAIALVFGACFMEQLDRFPPGCRAIVARNFDFVAAPPAGNHYSVDRLSIDFNQ